MSIKIVKQLITGFLRDEDGMETIEMVIILVVLVSIAFMFRKTIVKWYNELIGETIRPNVGEIQEAPSLQK
ncbi:Flp1 family type IVb pilin [Phosphitispora sp. TUW77]|uniref:Flp1 family type IVb pilin n=1 Tax=Phosphitispora sp. TUW77 TaxID=3152361 RepID=UPI003AB8A447